MADVQDRAHQRFEEIFQFSPSYMPECVPVETAIVKSQLRERVIEINCRQTELIFLQDAYRSKDEKKEEVSLTIAMADIDRIKILVRDISIMMDNWGEAITIARAVGFKEASPTFSSYLPEEEVPSPPDDEKKTGE